MIILEGQFSHNIRDLFNYFMFTVGQFHCGNGPSKLSSGAISDVRGAGLGISLKYHGSCFMFKFTIAEVLYDVFEIIKNTQNKLLLSS